MFDWITALFTSIPWLVVVGFLIYFAKNPEKVEKWASILARTFSFVSLRIEKSGLAKDIQSDINSFVKSYDLGKDKRVLPYRVKIDWISKTSREAFIRDGKVVIKMQRHENQARNFLYAVLDWVDVGLIPESRHLLDKRVLTAIDLSFVNKVLTEKKRHDSKQLFIDEIYESKAKKGSMIERYTAAFSRLDKRGLFVGVVLPEYSILGKNLGNEIPSSNLKLETIGFAEMLEKLSRKPHGEDVSPKYDGENIKCAIVLIARSETYDMRGLSPYLGFINKCCEGGTRSIYVCGIGDRNISIARKTRDAYEGSKKIHFVSDTIHPIDNNKAIVIRFEAHSLS